MAFEEVSTAACGVGMRVNLPLRDRDYQLIRDEYNQPIVELSHQVVLDGLKTLNDFSYRAGEDDGAGIKLHGLSPRFFNKLLARGEFRSLIGEPLCDVRVEKDHFAVGQFFLPHESNKADEAKSLIEESASTNGMKVVGWRDLNSAIDTSVLSANALVKKPGIWQAIMVPAHPVAQSPVQTELDIEDAALRIGLDISYQARQRNLMADLVSLSSRSIVYKGLIDPGKMGHFYRDLYDEDFSASSSEVHARFATNTSSQWRNAQPCVFFGLHNGELNSAPSNAAEMREELYSTDFHGIYPDPKLSDSMQFDADLLNQMHMKKIPFLEAFVRLMPPRAEGEHYSPEVKAMLQCFGLERTGYNGPAFMVASAMGYSIAALDKSGLRPSHWGIVEDREGRQQFHAASDDYLQAPEGGKILKKWRLEPGGMVVVTPGGEILDTEAVLESVCKRYHQDDPCYFQKLLSATTTALDLRIVDQFAQSTPTLMSPADTQNRDLFAAGWDYETQKVVDYMATNGMERVLAMGDDTNPLHSITDPAHIAHFMHQLFAQVSAPPLDSTNEPEDFSLKTFLGPRFKSTDDAIAPQKNAKRILIDSPILDVDELNLIEHHPDPQVMTYVIETSFELPTSMVADISPTNLLRDAISKLLMDAELAASRPGGGILVLSDRNRGPNRVLIPDVIAVAAVRKHLENKKLMHNVSIVADSYQAAGPHHAATLLTLGASAICPHGVYDKLRSLYADNEHEEALNYRKAQQNYRKAQEKCLTKTMGKMGLNDVNNYINGYFIAALGLDLFAEGEQQELALHPTLAGIFTRLYSPLRGINLTHIANSVLRRHLQAYHRGIDFTLLPHSGYYMPEEHGVKHGYGPVVVNEFTEWLKAEDTEAKLLQMHTLLERRGFPGFVDNAPLRFRPENGFLDPRQKDVSSPKGYYPPAYLEQFRPSLAFRKMTEAIDDYGKKHPTSVRDHFAINQQTLLALQKTLRLPGSVAPPLQSQQDIRALLFAGSMSQGALTVTDPASPEKIGAHETLTRGMNAIGAMSASGEGGEAPADLRDPLRLRTTRSKQIASGRFGVSAMQIVSAMEVEIKVAQGAKPGEGGQLPGLKVSIRFAAQRGGLPGTNFISPPPHHDIYSIEDLEELIHDIKSVNPKANVAVKLVASQGIGTIAVGVAKAGADIINIAGNSGGTGAAQQSSIKHAGLPSELGLAEVDKALRTARKRDLVKLRVSGGFKTAEDVIVAAILGADLFEFGTTAMLTLGCKMQRTCNQSCQPGVTTDGHLFKGDQLNTERYFVNLAAAIQERLQQLGVSSLQELRGRTELLELLDETMHAHYDFSPILDRSHFPPPLNDDELSQAEEARRHKLTRRQEDELIFKIQQVFAENPSAIFCSESIHLTTQDRTFGARIAGAFVKHLEEYPQARIILNTTGIAGQSFGFVTPRGMVLNHLGSVQDGCGKSMTGGELIITTPDQRKDYRADENTIAGNAFGYGASGGEVYVNGVAGHRAFVLAKGITAVIEGAGRRAFAYMTSGTGMILGQVGSGLCASAMGGIVFVYDKDNSIQPSESVRCASSSESQLYEAVIKQMLMDHLQKTHSVKAKEILDAFDPAHFKVLIPKAMDNIKTLKGITDVIKTYQLREAPITAGMRVWLEQKTLAIVRSSGGQPSLVSDIKELRNALRINGVLSDRVCDELLRITTGMVRVELRDIEDLSPASAAAPELHRKPKLLRPIGERLGRIEGGLDEILADALLHINAYVAELSHSAKGCSTCGAQSCAGGDDVGSGCPSGKNINTINSTLQRMGPIRDGHLTKAQWSLLREAFEIQIRKSPFIRYTGAACPAPCHDACTETIPAKGAPDPQRDGKPTGEHVHIKDIELYLDQIGRSLGWFNNQKEWSDQEIDMLFGGKLAKQVVYDRVMQHFKPPFRKPDLSQMKPGKELIIVGSGPAAMQIAFEALRDGLIVRMYEKSNNPGGLLADGIPAHKFDKKYLKEDFDHLIAMGLDLHLNSEVNYDTDRGGFYVKSDPYQRLIASTNNDNQHIALCVGAGKPKDLPHDVAQLLPEPQQRHIIQAIDFLKIANDIAARLKDGPAMPDEELHDLINGCFGAMSPLGKKIVVIGGGDTAQDVARWLARYFTLSISEERGHLTLLVRGPKLAETRGVHDSYPAQSRTPSAENRLQSAEVTYVNGDSMHLVEPTRIEAVSDEKLTVHLRQSVFKCHDQIESDSQLKTLSDALPRELRPLDSSQSTNIQIDDVDMVICALGFQGANSLPLVQAVLSSDATNVSLAGDAANVKPQIIVGAQASAHDTYHNRIREALGIAKEDLSLSPTRRQFSPLATNSLFAGSRKRAELRAGPAIIQLADDTSAKAAPG